ncbi:MAG: hypothetical protein U0694_27805 [Anaerolineae bacterium]
MWWSPDSTWALVRTTEGHFIINMTTQQPVLLVFQLRGDIYRNHIRDYTEVYWDSSGAANSWFQAVAVLSRSICRQA